MKEMNRREFLTLSGAAVVALSLAGCGGAPSAPTPPDDIRVQQALDALNQFRRDKGLTELVYEKDLEELTDLLISPFVKEGKPVVDKTKFKNDVNVKEIDSNSRHSRSASDRFGLITESRESGRTWRMALKMSKEGFCFPFSILAIYFTETLLFSAS